ncbi:hypothetical protein LEP1GSC170_1123 [Leptospira interrogans serovar Bataviae str. HAI135]|uniref:Uncharacterized protein n=2 Tax=Leptospira noguchii TaxID=28182 RepID=M6UWM2_9LEPT|nr:hypothetical protein LEP1GSC170_1123 [Leptospira interrogans serovar Bataviae str. HAI135]EMO41718.1 hypothetical protein LEP1GSC186_2012 [Leptospira noguchii serovar Autumnalis str. ZUN142]EMO55535.1 hypothetical protein LEP1GSC172_1441 [Leptospira noguchii]
MFAFGIIAKPQLNTNTQQEIIKILEKFTIIDMDVQKLNVIARLSIKLWESL